MSFSSAFSPSLSLHPISLNKTGRTSEWGLADQGTTEAQAGARQPLRDNDLPFVPAASIITESPGSTPGLRTREPSGSAYSAVVCFLKGAYRTLHGNKFQPNLGIHMLVSTGFEDSIDTLSLGFAAGSATYYY